MNLTKEFKPGQVIIITATLMLFSLVAAGDLCAAGTPAFIPVEDAGQWQAEIFIGSPNVKYFIQGPKLEGGATGTLAIDSKGNAFVTCGSFIQFVSKEGNARILTGTPGLTGNTDGPPWKTTFGSAVAIALASDQLFYVADAANFTVRKVEKKADGIWYTSTLAGIAGRKGHRDGAGQKALFTNPLDSVAVDEKGIVYVLDANWLRKIENGVVTTLNAGSGRLNGPLAEARFDRIMAGRSCLAYDGKGSLYVADRWGMAIRKVDLLKKQVSTVAGCLPGAKKDRPRDGKAFYARFHPGGGPVVVFYDRKHQQVIMRSADEGGRIRAIKDGWVKTWAGGPGTRKGPLNGPLTKCQGGSPCGVDRDGNVYITSSRCVRKVTKREAGAK
jgi:hypothetical protein